MWAALASHKLTQKTSILISPLFLSEQLRPAIQRIIQSHERGEHCLVRKELKGVKSQQFEGGLNKRYPMLYSEVEMSEDVRTALQKEEEAKMRLYPPASANEMEFHILKFYCFSSALVYNILKVGSWGLCTPDASGFWV